MFGLTLWNGSIFERSIGIGLYAWAMLAVVNAFDFILIQPWFSEIAMYVLYVTQTLTQVSIGVWLWRSIRIVRCMILHRSRVERISRRLEISKVFNVTRHSRRRFTIASSSNESRYLRHMPLIHSQPGNFPN